MAEAKEITGLDCNASATDWANKVLQIRFAEVAELNNAAEDFTTIESVHDMRVAIRRLRSALRDFLSLLKKRQLKNIRRNLKNLADALGAVRDADVAIIALKKLHAEIVDEQVKQGIENLLAKRIDLRERNRLILRETLANNRLAALQSDFEKAIERATKNSLQTFNQAGKLAVGESFNQFLEMGHSLYDPFEIESLHNLRIAAKRLRYALELFTACWGASLKPFAAEIAEMQAALGEVHDCDVWIEETGDLLRRESGDINSNELRAAIWLLSEFVKRRTRYYRNALKLWGEWQENDFASKMQLIINSVD